MTTNNTMQKRGKNSGGGHGPKKAVAYCPKNKRKDKINPDTSKLPIEHTSTTQNNIQELLHSELNILSLQLQVLRGIAAIYS